MELSVQSNHIVVSLARLQATDETKRIQADEHFDPKPFSLQRGRPSGQAGSPAVPAGDVPLPASSRRATSNQNMSQDLMISTKRLVLLSPNSQRRWEAWLGSHPSYGEWQHCPQGARQCAQCWAVWLQRPCHGSPWGGARVLVPCQSQVTWVASCPSLLEMYLKIMTACIFSFAGVNNPVNVMHKLITRHWRGMMGIALRKGSIQQHGVRDQYVSLRKSNKSIWKMTG